MRGLTIKDLKRRRVQYVARVPHFLILFGKSCHNTVRTTGKPVRISQYKVAAPDGTFYLRPQFGIPRIIPPTITTTS